MSSHKKGSLLNITKSVSNSKYIMAFNHLLARGAVARKAFAHVVKTQVAKEFRSYMENNTFPKFEGLESIERFQWPQLNEEFQAKIPIFTSALEGSMPKSKKMPERLRLLFYHFSYLLYIVFRPLVYKY